MSTIIHLPGADNCVADALSHPSAVHTSSTVSSVSPLASTSMPQVQTSPSLAPVLFSPPFPPENQLSTPGFDFSALPPLQPSCPSVQSMLSNPALQELPFPYSNSTVLCDVSAGSVRPLVPTVLRKQLFSAIHGISHPRIQASRRLISSCFVWPGMAKDIGLWSRGCIPCQQNKIQTHVKSSVPSIPVPSRRFAHVHIDLVGPLPSASGQSYILTMIDCKTRWP